MGKFPEIKDKSAVIRRVFDFLGMMIFPERLGAGICEQIGYELCGPKLDSLLFDKGDFVCFYQSSTKALPRTHILGRSCKSLVKVL